MQEILLAGGGKIGSLIAVLLAQSDDYKVHIVDIHDTKLIHNEVANLDRTIMDITNKQAILAFIKQHHITTVISCLPYFYNGMLAELAKDLQLHYFDLTEDVTVAAKVKALAHQAKTAFVPQCGLAPGFISIITHDLIQRFEKVDTAMMRVGALPQNPNNALKYALTWSTDGLINEYANTCYGIVDWQEISLQPLEGLETIEIDGLLYEAFNTSGGLGTLTQSQAGNVKNMNYKTLRYPGHCEKMFFLMKDLKMSEKRAVLKEILEDALPNSHQDVVVIYAAVTGQQNNAFFEETFVKKMYPQVIAQQSWTAIAVATAASACAVIDLVLQNPGKYQGHIVQESFTLTDFFNNRFGQYYCEDQRGNA
jgi:saccharopine dehydrogenase-like NADP-dependent oxidoreductase